MICKYVIAAALPKSFVPDRPDPGPMGCLLPVRHRRQLAGDPATRVFKTVDSITGLRGEFAK
jgi:hypothetical protein